MKQSISNSMKLIILKKCISEFLFLIIGNKEYNNCDKEYKQFFVACNSEKSIRNTLLLIIMNKQYKKLSVYNCKQSVLATYK